MKNIFSLAVLTLLLASCHPQPADHVLDSVAHDTAPADTSLTRQVALLPASDSLGECFSFSGKSEQRYMQLWREGISVHGQLDLQDEKQKVSGSFEGTIINDTMWIMHKFIADGKKMRREAVYVYSGGNLYEGQGVQETKDGMNYTFKNKQRLEFSKEPAMVSVKCE